MIARDSFAYPPRGMRRDEAARYIGVSVTEFQKLVNGGEIQGFKHSERGNLVYDREILDAYVTARQERAVRPRRRVA